MLITFKLSPVDLNTSCHSRLIRSVWYCCYFDCYQPNWSIELFCFIMKFKIFRLTPNSMIMESQFKPNIQKRVCSDPYGMIIMYIIRSWIENIFQSMPTLVLYLAMHVIQFFIILYGNSSEVSPKIFGLTLNVIWGTISLFEFLLKRSWPCHLKPNWSEEDDLYFCNCWPQPHR